MDKRTRSRLQKTLLAMLAYNPGEFRLVGSKEGWVKISDVVKALHEEGLFRFLTPKSLFQFMAMFCQDHLELHEDSSCVRARDETLRSEAFRYPVAIPPARLYVPIRKRAALNVEKKGLAPAQGTAWVVLCSEEAEALHLGRRRGAMEIVCVDSKGAEDRGVVFRHGGGCLYLADWIPSQALSFSRELSIWMRMEEAERKERKRQEELAGQKGLESLLSLMAASDTDDYGQERSGGKKRKGAEKTRPGSIFPTAERLSPLYDEKELLRQRFSKKRGKRTKRGKKGPGR